jgi:alkylation response protein AidB-like acyl-CoA dehydrogenase
LSQLTDEQRALVSAVREFAERECGTREQRDTLTDNGANPTNPEIARKLGQLGWLGIGIPPEYGGSGGGLYDLCLFVEELSYGRIPVASYPVTAIVAAAYNRFADEQIKKEVLGGVVAGAPESIAMSEPGSGSDVASLRCQATPIDGGYLINGQKTWCSSAHIAHHILLVARTATGGSKHDGLSMISIPAGHPGMTNKRISTMGGSEVNDVFFTDCFVPADRLVGSPDQGWSQLIAGLNVERVIIGAMYTGLARRAFDDALRYVRQREQFGRPVGTFQALAHRIADLATELTATRLLVHDVARRVDGAPDQLLPREASMAKLKASEVAKRVALDGMQMMGGYGYATEYDMESLVRSALIGTVVGGTSEVQRDIIAKTYGL